MFLSPVSGERSPILNGISVLSATKGACRPAEPMSESAFESLADSLLAALEEGIGAHADAELQGGILTVDGDAIGGAPGS